jgi:hypothetical protein
LTGCAMAAVSAGRSGTGGAGLAVVAQELVRHAFSVLVPASSLWSGWQGRAVHPNSPAGGGGLGSFAHKYDNGNDRTEIAQTISKSSWRLDADGLKSTPVRSSDFGRATAGAADDCDEGDATTSIRPSYRVPPMDRGRASQLAP